MASFDIAYNKYIKPNEGGYAFVPNDKGGETYAGIARNYNPGWEGWSYIDFIKRTKGPIAINTMLPDIQFAVDKFYLNRWNVHRFGEINSQAIANLLFDFHVHSQAHAIKAIQQLTGVTADGVMGPRTIAAINSADPEELHDQLKAYRIRFLNSLIQQDPTQAGFFEGWMKRMANFPTLLAANAVKVGAMFAVAGLLIAGYYYSQKMATS